MDTEFSVWTAVGFTAAKQRQKTIRFNPNAPAETGEISDERHIPAQFEVLFSLDQHTGRKSSCR